MPRLVSLRTLLIPLAACVAMLIGPSAASAAPPTPLGLTCVTGGASYYECGTNGAGNPDNVPSLANTYDGMPIDVSVALPDPGTYGNGPYPLVMTFHGYGGQKLSFSSMSHFTAEGYAVFSMTDRGFRNSCGNAATSSAPACDGQYVRLMDTRYEVRDAQFFAGQLADEGLAVPTKVAAIGGSYGGGMSMALAALKDRTMLQDGRLVPWKSPSGTPMSLAVASPQIPWTDLAYSLVPNGRVLDYVRDNSYDPNHFGVMKQSYVNGLYTTGSAVGRYAPAGILPQADLSGWLSTMNQGEPYQGSLAAANMLSQVTSYHSSYYIDHSEAPAPMLISSGFTDDLFPVDEALRFYNRTKDQYPSADIGLFFGDFGHPRAQNKADVTAALNALQDQWLNYYLTATGSKPANNAVAYTVTCPKAAASGGPFSAPNWASIAPGEITVEGGATDQTIQPDGGTAAVASAFNPPLGGGACAAPSADKEPGTANYDSAAAPAGGFTMLGSPIVVADLEGAGQNSEIAARLVDVAPDGTETLVARQLYRPNPSGYQVFQLHPGSWHFDAGHIARLELLPKDAASPASPGNLANYGRPSDRQQAITVHDLVLRLPVTDAPGALGGIVKAPAAKILPDDRGPVDLAPGYEPIGSETMAQWVASRPVTPATTGRAKLGKGGLAVSARKLRLKVTCPSAATSCPGGKVTVQGAPKKGKQGRFVIAKGSFTATGGQTKTLSLNLTKAAKRYFKSHRSLRARVTISNAGTAGSSKVIRSAKKPARKH